MIDPEDPAAKNEQELNLFADQPQSEDAPAKPESGAAEASDMIQAEEPKAPAPESSPEPVPQVEDSPVVAPPPPRKQPSSVRPGIVSPRAGRAFPPASSSASASTGAHKPLPHPIQQDQTLGQTLVSIRNARGLSLEEVALATRIRMDYLTELESDELLKTLPHVYVSAYVRKLIEVYDLSRADGEALIEKMNVETPQDEEELPNKLIESVNEGGMVNEGENKRIRNITIIFFSAIGIVAAAILWLVILVIVRYVRTSDPAPGRDPAAQTGAVQPAEEPVSQTVLLDESELDALIVPETPSISVLKMSKVPGVRETP